MNPNYPARVTWQNIRFDQVKPERDELVRYEASFAGAFHGTTLWLWNSKQWGAKFRGGSYSIADSIDEALIKAASIAKNMLLHDAFCLENLIYGDEEFGSVYFR